MSKSNRSLKFSMYFVTVFVALMGIAYYAAVYAADDDTPSSQLASHFNRVAAADPLAVVAPPPPAVSDAELQRIGQAAQRPPQVTVLPTGSDFTGTVSSLAQIILALLGAVLAWPLAKFFGTQSSATQILNDAGMAKYATYAAELAVRWALQATGNNAVDLKNVELRKDFIGYAVDFLRRQFPEVTQWVITSGTLSDFVEAHLPHDAALPPKTA